MSKFKPTEGDWKVEERGAQHLIVSDLKQEVIAQVWTQPMIGPNESESNARLIANSKKMYEALKEMIDELGEFQNIIQRESFANAKNILQEIEGE